MTEKWGSQADSKIEPVGYLEPSSECVQEVKADRRKYGTGSIRQLNGKWYARSYLKGKQIEKCFGYRKDLAEEYLVQRAKLSKSMHWSWRDPDMIITEYKPENYPEGHVYLALAGEYAKIGFTTQAIGRRMHSFRSQGPFEVKLIFCIHGSLELEQEIHKTFRKQHMRREWFAFNPSLERFAMYFAQPHLQSQVWVKGTDKKKDWQK